MKSKSQLMCVGVFQCYECPLYGGLLYRVPVFGYHYTNMCNVISVTSFMSQLKC